MAVDEFVWKLTDGLLVRIKVGDSTGRGSGYQWVDGVVRKDLSFQRLLPFTGRPEDKNFEASLASGNLAWVEFVQPAGGCPMCHPATTKYWPVKLHNNEGVQVISGGSER
jgi:hypothetical protein